VYGGPLVFMGLALRRSSHPPPARPLARRRAARQGASAASPRADPGTAPGRRAPLCR
jgi:hypothetical protein